MGALPLTGVLALQGAFREHIQMLRSLGAPTREIRQRAHLDGVEALIIPGGESTTMGKLLLELDLFDGIRMRIEQGMPVYGSCAGMILLCKRIEHSDQPRLGVLDATVRRNAFGRQVDSFEAELDMKGIDGKVCAVFIRAPLILETGDGVDVLARADMTPLGRSGGEIVAVRQNNVLATSFHPELTPDTRVHQYFLNMIQA